MESRLTHFCKGSRLFVGECPSRSDWSPPLLKVYPEKSLSSDNSNPCHWARRSLQKAPRSPIPPCDQSLSEPPNGRPPEELSRDPTSTKGSLFVIQKEKRQPPPHRQPPSCIPLTENDLRCSHAGRLSAETGTPSSSESPNPRLPAPIGGPVDCRCAACWRPFLPRRASEPTPPDTSR